VQVEDEDLVLGGEDGAGHVVDVPQVRRLRDVLHHLVLDGLSDRAPQ
jgi:hypothetical protein